MEILVRKNEEHKSTRKGKYHKDTKLFYAKVDMLKCEDFCQYPHLYLTYRSDYNEFVFGVGDQDDCDIYVYIPFSEKLVHELLNIMRDYEGSYFTIKDAYNLVNEIEDNFKRGT